MIRRTLGDGGHGCRLNQKCAEICSDAMATGFLLVGR